MVSAPEDDFTNFLDFGDINFAAFDAIPDPTTDLSQQNGAGAMDTSMEGATGMLSGFQHPTEPFPDLALQSELFEQQRRQQIHLQNQRYHAQQSIPPTPDSMKMHDRQAQYYRTPTDQQQLHMYDHYRRTHKDQVSCHC